MTPPPERYDVVVVGAGPAGSTAAHELARRGHRVLLTEEHPRVGFPVQCAGLVSQRVLELAGTREMVLHEVRGATVWSPALRPLQVKAPDTRAYVISRSRLDFLLAERASRAGAEVRTGWKFLGLEGPVSATLPLALRFQTLPEGEVRRVEARCVVGADGVTSAVARAFRLRRPIEILPAYEVEMPFPDGDPDEVEIYLGRHVAPGLFGWWIADGGGMARVGLAVQAIRGRSAREYFDALRGQMARRWGHPLPDPVEILVAGIPVGDVPRTSGTRVLLVGDAAAQVKPVSGGGIFTGMRCAQRAAEVLHEALAQDDLGGDRLAAYDAAWRSDLGEEFRRAHYLRRVFLRLGDEELERVLQILQGTDMVRSLVAFGDIDFPSIAAGEVLRQSRSLMSLLPQAVAAYFQRDRGRVPDVGPRISRRAT